MSDENIVTLEVNIDEMFILLGTLGLQAEDPESVESGEHSALHDVRYKLIDQFDEQYSTLVAE